MRFIYLNIKRFILKHWLMELMRLRNYMVHHPPAGGPGNLVVMLADLEALRPGDESQPKGSRRSQSHSDSQAAVNSWFFHIFVLLRLSG